MIGYLLSVFGSNGSCSSSSNSNLTREFSTGSVASWDAIPLLCACDEVPCW